MSDFRGAVEVFVRKSDARMLAIFETAAEAVFEEAQTPVAQGGHMPVDTGFLRASGRMLVDSTLVAQGRDVRGRFLPIKLGSTIRFEWSANYASFQEAKNGFMRLALQNWQHHVDAAAREAQQRYP